MVGERASHCSSKSKLPLFKPVILFFRKTTEVLVLVLVICGLAHAQYNNGRRSGGSRTRGFTLRDIFSNYRQYDIYGGDYNRGNAGPRYDVYGSYDNRGGYDNRGSYDNRGGYDGGYGNRGGYDGGYDIPGLFDIRDFFRGRREQKKVFGVSTNVNIVVKIQTELINNRSLPGK